MFPSLLKTFNFPIFVALSYFHNIIINTGLYSYCASSDKNVVFLPLDFRDYSSVYNSDFLGWDASNAELSNVSTNTKVDIFRVNMYWLVSGMCQIWLAERKTGLPSILW